MLERWMDAARRNKLAAIELALLLAAAITLRFINLGYSDFQGDEISAICHPSHFDSLIKFLGYLLGQKKGPVQYIISCAIGILDPAISSELLLRFPFALANALSMVCVFFMAWHLFDLNSAIFGTFLAAANGMFVAFGRIVQYQSFVLLGVSASLLFMVLAVKRDRWRLPGLYLSYFAAAGALLAHFDAAFVFPPLAVLTVYWWLEARHRPGSRRMAWHLLTATAVAALPLLLFYTEYAHRVGQSSLQYWANRITGSPTNSLATASYYAPGVFVGVSLGAAAIGLLRIRWNLGWQVMLSWLIPPLAFFELFFGDSRTHIYAYVLPLTLIAGLGLAGVAAWIKRHWGTLAGQAARAGILIFLVLDAYASYDLLIDHSVEYPWQPKTVLGINMPGGNLGATFGFPYNRQWRAIGAWFAAQPGQEQVLTTNEKLSIAGFYLPDTVHFKYIWRDAPKRLPEGDRIYFLVIRHPQSWVDQLWGRTFDQWHVRFEPAADFANDRGEVVASVYLISMDQYRSAVEN